MTSPARHKSIASRVAISVDIDNVELEEKRIWFVLRTY
jgi:hypothetical protein